MNFSSIPAYLDPANWQQQGGNTIQNHHHQQLTSAPPPPVLPPPPVVVPPQPHGGGGAGSIRPGSMADRARLANIPMPETALKCPRCDSTNTKFCYFNNYSLSQPRHFCKACKRYWTRGGALRSVPVGGGCRRNKRSSNNNKSGNNNNNNNNNNNSKSPASSTSTDGRQGTNNSGSTSTISSHSNTFSGQTSAASLLGLMNPQIPPLRFMSPLGQFSSDHHHHHHHHFTPSNHMNLNFSTSCGNVLGGTTHEGMMVSNNHNLLGVGAEAGAGAGVGVGGVASLLSSGNLENWRMQQQFPNFLGGFDPSNSPSSYPFQGGVVHEAVQFLGGESTSQISRPKISTSMLNQMASVKMEDNINNNNNNNNNQDQSALSRQLLGIQGNNENWNTSASAWSDLSASFSSSSTSNAL